MRPETDSPIRTRRVDYRVFEALGEACGVVVTDPASLECVFRFRHDWDVFAGSEAETLSLIAEDLPAKLQEMGPRAFLNWVDDTLSNTFRVQPPAEAMAVDLARTAQALYRKIVHTTVRQYLTHLPLVPIDLAAGGLGEDRAKGAEEWVEAEVPGRRGLSDDLFVVRIHGRSMEPEIPDGSLCIFRSYYGGSRRGGIFIVRRAGTIDEGGEYTIKRYQSEKAQTAGGGWEHTAIHMHPDNPDFAGWDLKEGENWTTVAQFVTVLEDPL